jgi:predicted aldo/keto reductase-like oxidoreductase
MKYRRFGKLDWKVSALGFGAMRLPIICGEAGRIDEPEATKMITCAIDQGVNYIDSGYTYHKGNSETLLGKILKGGYREKVKVATKMPTWLVKSHQDMDKCLNEQLSKLQLDHLDFYLLHGLNKERWQRLTELDVLSWAERKMDEGKFEHFGFSFHDEYEVFKNIIDSYERWTLCQIQYNYADAGYQAGTRGLKYAASKGLAVVAMEPIAGGRLAIKPPKEVQTTWDESGIKRTAAEWALQWVWNQPEVSVALSGMSTMKQVEENMKSADSSGPGLLTEKELELINRVSQKYRELGFIGCTGCGYCTPCPEGVSIPQIASFFNEFFVKNRSDEVRKKYLQQISPECRAERCVKCGKCEELCPQQLPIREILSRVTWLFEQGT